MDNFDFYLENLNTAKNSTGALDEQQKIYEEGWAAASKRVQASIEDIWHSLIDDESFITITNAFADFLTLIDSIIDGLGGLKGVLLLIGSIITKVFSVEMSAGVTAFGNKLKSLTPSGKTAVIEEQFKTKREANASLRNQPTTNDYQYQVNNAQADVYDAYIDKTTELIAQGKVLSEQEANKKSNLIDQVKILGDMVTEQTKLAELARNEANLQKRRVMAGRGSNSKAAIESFAQQSFELGVYGAYNSRVQRMKNNPATANSYEQEKEYLQKMSKKALDKFGEKNVDNISERKLRETKTTDWTEEEQAALAYLKILKQVIEKEKEREKKRKNGEKDVWEDDIDTLADNVEIFTNNQEENTSRAVSTIAENMPEKDPSAILELETQMGELGARTADTSNTMNNFEGAVEKAELHAAGLTGKLPTLSDSFVALSNVMMTVSMTVSSLKSIWDTWNDEDASFGDKMLTTFSSLAVVIPMVTSAFSAQNLSQLAVIASAIGSILPINTMTAAEANEAIAAAIASKETGKLAATLWAALWPIALVAAAIVALVGVIYLLVKKSKEQYEQAKKNAEQAKEYNEKLKEQKDKVDQLKNSLASLTEEYKKNKAAGEDTAETYAQLVSNLQQLKAAYDDLDISDATKNKLEQGMQRYLATGDASSWDKAVEQADQEVEQLVADSNANYAAAWLNFAKAAEKNGKEATAESQEYKEQADSYELIQNDYGSAHKYTSEAYEKLQEIAENGGISRLNFDGEYSFIKSYQNMQKKLDELFLSGEGTSQYYKDIEQVLENYKDYYNEIAGIFDDVADYKASEAFKSLGISSESINSVSEYQEALEQLSNGLQNFYGNDMDAATKAAEQYLQKFENVNAQQSAIDFLERFGNVTADAKKAARGAYKELFIKEPTLINPYITNSSNPSDYSQWYEEFQTPKNNIESFLSSLDLTDWVDSLTAEQKSALSYVDLSGLDFNPLNASADNYYQTTLNKRFLEAWQEYIDDSTAQLLTSSAEKYDFDADYLTSLGSAFLEMSREGEEGYGLLKDNADLAAQTAINYARLNRGVLDLSENYTAYTELLGDVQKAQTEVDQAALASSESGKKLKSSLSDVLGVTEDLISTDFLKGIDSKTFESAAKGEDAGLSQLRKQFGKSITIDVDLGDLDFDSIWDQLEELEDGTTIEIDGDIGNFIDAVTQAKLAAGATVEEIQNMFSGIGIDLDTTTVSGTLEEMEAAAEEAGGVLVENTAVTVEPVVEEVPVVTSQEVISYDEKVSSGTHKQSGTVLEDGAFEPKPVTINVPYASKSVEGTVDTISSSGVQEAVSFSSSNAAGHKAGKSGSQKTSATSGSVPRVLSSKLLSGDNSSSSAGPTKANAHTSSSSTGTILIPSKKSPNVLVASPSTQRQATENVNDARDTGSNGGGGGSSKPRYAQVRKPIEEKNLEEEIERYHEINQLIKDQEALLERLSKAKDTTYGTNKLKAIQEEIDANKVLIEQNEQLLAEAKANLASDQSILQGYGVTFDEEGRINNYDEIIAEQAAIWHEKRQAAEDALYQYDVRAAATEDYDPEGKEKLELEMAAEAVDDEYETFKDYIKLYEDSYEQIQEASDKNEDLIRTSWEKNYEKITVKLQYQLELDESNIADIELQLQRIGENSFARSAERIALTVKEQAYYLSEAKNQMAAYEDAVKAYQRTLSGDIKNGISEVDFNTIQKESKDTIMSIEKTMRKAIEAIGDELRTQLTLIYTEADAIFEKIDRRLKFAEFYEQIVKSIYGETQDYYDALNPVIDSHIELIKTQLDGLISYRDQLTTEQSRLYAALQDEQLSEAEREQFEETLSNVESEIAKVNETVQSDITSLADLARTEFESAIEEISKTWQRQNFGGQLLDEILDEIELKEKAQEELLTQTNQIYETNKLIRQAESDILKTTNKRTKQAYQEYIYKVEQKQEQNELTQLELDLLTAEYEITKAQIALEEAQNAKNTVRLTRDSEGNFGYVYTANQDKVSNAEQALEDATNNYYNIALKGAQSSAEEIYQLEKQWLEDVTEIKLDETLTEEQKQQKIEEITEYYNTLIAQQRDKFYIAKAAAEESSYSHKLDYDLKEIESAENWFETQDELLDDMGEAQEGYQDRMSLVSEYVKQAYNKQETAVETLDKATAVYGIDLDKLIPKLEQDLPAAIDEATRAWEAQRDMLAEVVALTNQLQGVEYNSDEKELYSEDYAARIKTLIQGNYQYEDYEIQQLLGWRWEKLSGKDNTDYKALMNELAAEGKEDSVEYKLYEMLRRYKLEHTDIGTSDFSNKEEMIEEKLGQDFHQLIDNYLKSSKASWYDKTVQNWLSLRQTKIEQLGLAGEVKSNEELEEEFRKKYPEKFKISNYTGNQNPENKENSSISTASSAETVTDNATLSSSMAKEASEIVQNNTKEYIGGASTGINSASNYSYNSNNNNTTNYNVTVNADFPNATDHEEIVEALDNITNAAIQRSFQTVK